MQLWLNVLLSEWVDLNLTGFSSNTQCRLSNNLHFLHQEEECD